MIAALPEIPSYAQGFARQRGDSAYPGLWDGLVGLWVAPLGPTGLTLLNFSPGGQALGGTLTNMDPGTNWVGSRYGWALSFPDTTDYVEVPHAAALAPQQISVRAIFKTPASFPSFGEIVSKGKAGPTRVDYSLVYYASGRLAVEFCDGSWHTHGIESAVTTDTWYDVVFSLDGARAKIWVDGRLRLDEAETNPMPHTSGALYLGNYAPSLNWSLRGRLVLVAIWDRVLAGGEVEQLYGDHFAPLRLRRRVWSMPPAIGGPYYVTAGQTFHAGAAAGGVFQAGTAKGELFSTGSIIGECHGRSG